MIKKILVGLIVILAIFFGAASLQPDSFSISRSTHIAAPAASVFALVNDFHRWADWSPWAKLDPSMKASYAGTLAGEGSSYSWIGNSKVGEGRMTILRSQAPELILINLEFLKPMKANNLTTFAFKSEGEQTQVTWTMTGKNNLLAKAIQMIMDMEKMVGPDFERGLAQLKTIAEKR